MVAKELYTIGNKLNVQFQMLRCKKNSTTKNYFELAHNKHLSLYKRNISGTLKTFRRHIIELQIAQSQFNPVFFNLQN